MNAALEITLIFVLILLNGFFSMFEMAMVSSRKVRLEQLGEGGSEGASKALKLLESPNRYLSTVQIAITLISILSGAFGGARLSKPLAALFAKWSWFGENAETIAFIIVVILITFFSLVLGELVPKRIALSNPERTASLYSGFMDVLSGIMRPIGWLLGKTTNFFIHILGIKPKVEPVVSEEEIKLLIEDGAEQGIFEEEEQDMVSAVFRLGERRADAIMTPRTDLVWIDLDDSKEEIASQLCNSAYSRIPVAHGSLDKVVGMVYLKDLTGVNIDAPDFNLQDYAHEALFVPENTQAMTVFEQFRSTGKHQALVLDEYGGVEGMITLYDMLEAIMGDIPQDELDHEQEAVQREDGSWLLDGLIPIDELKEILDIDKLPDEENAAYQTLSGFVMYMLSQIPKIGQSFVYDGYNFEVMDMDGRRVDRILVTKTLSE